METRKCQEHLKHACFSRMNETVLRFEGIFLHEWFLMTFCIINKYIVPALMSQMDIFGAFRLVFKVQLRSFCRCRTSIASHDLYLCVYDKKQYCGKGWWREWTGACLSHWGGRRRRRLVRKVGCFFCNLHLGFTLKWRQKGHTQRGRNNWAPSTDTFVYEE